MSESKLAALEQEISSIKNNQSLLIVQMRESTIATRELTASTGSLTSEIKHLIKSVDKSESAHNELEKRVSDTETDIAVLNSRGRVSEWIGRAVVTSVVGAIMAFFIIKG